MDGFFNGLFMPATTQGEKVKKSSRIFVARQPIFRRNKKVYAYELLFRSGLDNFFDPTADGEIATSNVITDSFLLLGIANVTMGRRAFINFNGPMIVRDWPALFPSRQTVVEILEDVEVTQELVDACRSLVNRGYILALDDFLYEPRFDPLLELVDIVKFDVQQMGRGALERQVDQVRKNFRVKLLAEKIENDDEFDAALELGFELFQGYFFKKPHILSGLDIPGAKLQYLEILRLIRNEFYDFDHLSRLIADDVSLSYKLLKYVNSPCYRRRSEIRSLKSAVALVGEEELRKWLSLVMMSDMAEDKPDELVRLAVIRGQFCEILGGEIEGEKGRDRFHTVGMFSLLDALLDRPMDELLAELNFSDEINHALTGKSGGLLAQVLHLVKAYEMGAWERVTRAADSLGLDTDRLPEIFIVALERSRYFEALLN